MAFGKFERLSTEAGITKEVPSPEKPIVVIIDDDVNICQMLRLTLQNKYAVYSYHNGEDGVKGIHRNVHAVILDIKMPGMDGFQVYLEVQPKFPDIPIIFFSAYQDVLEGAKLSLKYKPFTYIDKGSNIKELFESVDRAVESYKRILTMDQIAEKVRSKTSMIKQHA